MRLCPVCVPLTESAAMNFKIEKIREAELQTDKLVAQEKKMRRSFLADGTVDAKEQKQLDEVEGKIAKLKGAVAKIRAEIEAARRAWEARGTDWSRARSEMDELGAWGHAQHPKVKAEADKIDPLTKDQMWAEAVKQLDAVLKVLTPAVDDYRKQVAAKTEYEPLRKDTDTRLSRAAGSDAQTAEVADKIAGLTQQLGVVDSSLGSKDYVSALATVQGMAPDLDTLEVLVRDARAQKDEFAREMAALAPRLKEAQGCEADALADKLVDLNAGEADITEAAGKQDYAAARSGVAALAPKVDVYMAEYAAQVDAQTLYEKRLPRIEGELGRVRDCRYPDLTAQQTAILDTETQMRGMAGAGSFEQAIEEMNKLDPLLEKFREDEENARLGEEYRAKATALAPRMDKVRVCNFPPLEEAQAKINADHDAASKAADGKKYADALALLGDVEVGLGDFDEKLKAQEQAQTDYENGLGQITPRYQAVASSKYPQLAGQDMEVMALHDKMQAAAAGRDFVAAFAAMTDLEREIGVVETTLETLEAKQAEYETRNPPLVQRFDGAMVSDYAQLEDERDRLQTARGDMEAAAKNRDFPLALDHLNAVERMLNDLDSQAGNLDAMKAQYQAVLAQIEAGLTAVADCNHAELTPKKTPIMDLRADMLASAQEEDFGVALERANTLVPLVAEFAKLEVLLEDYLRRLEVIKPRLETVKGFTYKSLKEAQTKIATLATEMQAQAAKAELADAVKKMGELEKLVTEIIALNDELKLQEAVYKKLHGDLAGKMKAIEALKTEGEGDDMKVLRAAVEAAKTSFEALKDLGAKDEYIKAIPQADDVAAKIESVKTAMQGIKDNKAAFDMLRAMADEGYAAAKGKADDYPDLKTPFEKLTKLHEAMTKVAEAAAPDYADGKAKAQKVLDELKAFDGTWVETTNREAAVKAAADVAIARFKSLPKEAAEKAEDDYGDAKEAVADLQEALKEKKLERAEEKVAELNKYLDKIDGALKTQEEHKADYEGRLASIQPRVEKARGTPFASALADELAKVNDAFEEMTERAGAEDWEGGVKAAPGVEGALDAFDKAEDVLEQLKAKLDERMVPIRSDMGQVDGLAARFPDMMPAAINLRRAFIEVEGLLSSNKLQEADAPSEKLRDDLRSFLADAEAHEDAQAEAEKQAEKDKGILEDVKDLGEKVWDKATDKIEEEIVDYVDGKVTGAKNLYEGVKDVMDDNLVDGGIKIIKGLDDLSPIPVSKTVRKGAKIAEEVYDVASDVAGEAVDYIAEKLK